MGEQGPFLLGSGIAILAGMIAFFCIPNIGPDSLEQEDLEFKQYLEENGFDTTQFMGDQAVVPVDGPLDPTANGK